MIIFIDGDKGELLYCGYLIDQLVVDLYYLEVCYFLFYGNLLLKIELEVFENIIMCYIMIYEQMYNFFCGFCCDVYLMVIMVGVVGVMVVFYYDLIDIIDECQCEIVLYCLIVKMLIIVVMVYKYLIG